MKAHPLSNIAPRAPMLKIVEIVPACAKQDAKKTYIQLIRNHIREFLAFSFFY